MQSRLSEFINHKILGLAKDNGPKPEDYDRIELEARGFIIYY